MVAMRDIEEFGRSIGREFNAEKVLLFGSYAEGIPAEDSDVDILVIAPHEGRSVDTSVAIRLKLHPPFPLDLLVRTREKVAERVAGGDPFLGHILEHGKVLYEARDGGMD